MLVWLICDLEENGRFLIEVLSRIHEDRSVLWCDCTELTFCRPCGLGSLDAVMQKVKKLDPRTDRMATCRHLGKWRFLGRVWRTEERSRASKWDFIISSRCPRLINVSLFIVEPVKRNVFLCLILWSQKVHVYNVYKFSSYYAENRIARRHIPEDSTVTAARI